MPDCRSRDFTGIMGHSGFRGRRRLLSHTALATTIMLGGLVLAGPSIAGDVTGGPGANGVGGLSSSFPPELIGTEGGGISVSKVTGPATGGNANPGDPGMGTPAVTPGESSNGTGGAGGLVGNATSGGIGALDIILNETVDNALDVTLTTGAATGGIGGAGGAGTGGTGGTGNAGPDGDNDDGGPGVAGGPANGTGGAGGAGGDAVAGAINAMTVTVTGDIISASTFELTGGSATGGAGGAGGAGTGGTAGAGGAGGSGGLNDDGGRGGAGGSAIGQGAAGGIGGDAFGGGIGTVAIAVTGNITSAASLEITGGSATGGAGGAGGAGTGGTAGAGGAGGYGDDGGAGGGGGSAAGLGGVGGAAGDAFGGSISPVTIIVTGDITSPSTLAIAGGSATGGAGGAGGAGTGGTAGAGGAGGNGYRAGTGGTGGSAAGLGGAGGAGGDAFGGDIDPVTVTVTGDITSPSTFNISGGSATGGTGGAGGAGTGRTAGAGGLAGNGDVYDGGGGTGGTADGQGGVGGVGGDAFGGSIDALTVTVTGDITSATTLELAGGSATGGAGGAGGGGWAGAGGAGRTSGSYGGNGGGGGSANGLGGAGGAGGDAFGGGIGAVTLAVTGNITSATTLEMIGGSATGGAGGAGMLGSSGIAGAGGTGGYDYYASTGGAGGSANGVGGAGGVGGDAFGGSIDAVTITVMGDISSATTLEAVGGSAIGGAGGAGGDGAAYVAGAGGAGGHGYYGGTGGAGGSANGLGGAGGVGGDAFGGSIGAVAVTVTGDITSTTTLEMTGGSATGGAGGAGGAGTGGSAGSGGAGGNGTALDGYAGAGGTADSLGGAAGSGGNATGGNVYATMTSHGTITLTGDAITITALAGAATGGAGGTGGSANGRTGATGATSPDYPISGYGGPGGTGGSGGAGGAGGAGGNATGGDATVIQSNGSDFSVTGDAITVTAKAGDATGGIGGIGGSANGGMGGTGGAGGFVLSGADGPGGDGGNGGTGGVGGEGGDAEGGNAVVTLSNSGNVTVTGGTAISIIATAGNGTGGAGGAGGSANGGNGGSGVYPAFGAGGNGGTGGDGGKGGDGVGGEASVEVSNDGGIFATGNGIDIIATAGTGTAGTAGAGGTADAGLGLNTNGTAGTAGDPGSAGTGTNGRSSITVDNSGVVDVGGIGVKALANGDNGTIQINNTGGTITGGAGGVVVATDLGFVGNSDIDIANSGLITSGDLLNAAAIDAKGASAEILNSGTVRGFIDLTELDDTFDNEAGGVFAARGTSDFGSGVDQVNNAGTVHTAGDSLADEDVVFDDLEGFGNSGWISLVDGQEGDSFTLKGTAYESTGGRLAVDAELGPSGKSDRLIFDGVGASTNGATRVSVNVTGVSGANTNGIAVVEAINGATTHDGDFALDGPLYAGFYTWDMRRDGDTFELFTSGVGGTGAHEFAAGITAAQDIWYQTTGTLLQRQADLRPLLGGTQVTPVADFSEPVAPTPAGQVGPGFWVKGVGAWLERDQGNGLDVTDRKQSIYGGLAGFDFATEGAGDSWLFGLYGGYLGSKLKFNETDTQWIYDGPTVGAYATYLNQALYVDMLVKADFLSINIDPDDVADDADTDGINVGGLIDAGYKFGSGEGVFVEPQATLAVLHTEIDDVDIFGGTVEFDDQTSVRGRLGLRLGYDHTAANQMIISSDVTASVWQEFNGSDNEATIVTADFPAFGVSDAPDETVGDISLGFSVAAPEGWSGFARGSYQFADDYEAFSGNLGLRYSW
jgi:hypothetical protein